MYVAFLTSIMLAPHYRNIKRFRISGVGERGSEAVLQMPAKSMKWERTFRMGMNFQKKLTCMQNTLWQGLQMSTG